MEQTNQNDSMSARNTEYSKKQLARQGYVLSNLWHIDDVLQSYEELTVEEAEDLKPDFWWNIVVPKNEWGQRMINRINLILKLAIPTDEFYEGLAKWIPDELKASFRKGYERRLYI